MRSVLLGLVGAAVLFGILLVRKNKGKYFGSNRRIVDKTIAFFMGIVYGYMVIGITYLCREPIFEHEISLVPFSAPVGNPRLWAYLVENIIMFIPYGFIIPILNGRFEKWYRCLILGCLSSMLIETVQYMSARGKAQIDDVIMNTAGMMVGWAVFTAVARIYRKRKKEE